MIRFGLALSALGLATTLALAQTGIQGSAPHGTRGHQAHDAQALKTQQAAKVSLLQAVETAEGKGPGRAVDAEFKIERGIAQYEIKVLGSDGKLLEHHVDATSGQIIKSESHPVEAFFTRLKPADVQSASTTLRQAITVAEQKASGRAVEAEVEREGNALRYDVTVATGDRTQKVRVGADGQAVLTN